MLQLPGPNNNFWLLTAVNAGALTVVVLSPKKGNVNNVIPYRFLHCMRSEVGPVIQATGRTKFEDGLMPKVLHSRLRQFLIKLQTPETKPTQG